MLPRVEDGEAWSKDRLAPMLRNTPCLRGKVADVRTRDSNNQIRHKQFPGGNITIAGANSPAGLAMRPIRYVLLDEVDRYVSRTPARPRRCYLSRPADAQRQGRDRVPARLRRSRGRRSA